MHKLGDGLRRAIGSAKIKRIVGLVFHLALTAFHVYLAFFAGKY